MSLPEKIEQIERLRSGQGEPFQLIVRDSIIRKLSGEVVSMEQVKTLSKDDVDMIITLIGEPLYEELDRIRDKPGTLLIEVANIETANSLLKLRGIIDSNEQIGGNAINIGGPDDSDYIV